MEKYSLKQIKAFGNEKELNKRVEKWQIDNQTTAVPGAKEINLECIGYSQGKLGCNGSVFRDIDSGMIIGVAGRGYNIYIR